MLKDCVTDLVVFDVEITHNPTGPEVGGWDNTDRMGISVAVLWESLTGRFLFYEERDRDALQRRLNRADVISGFNIYSFDLPVVFQRPRREFVWQDHIPNTAAIFDVHRLARVGLGRRLDGACGQGLGLDACARLTLGAKACGGKTGDGADAPGMYQRGEIARLCGYCLDDVRLERDLLLFAVDHGYFLTGQGACRIANAIESDPLLSTLVGGSGPASDWLYQLHGRRESSVSQLPCERNRNEFR